MSRRYIRDTVANDYRPEWKIKLDKQLDWLDAVERACKEQPKEVFLSNVAE